MLYEEIPGRFTLHGVTCCRCGERGSGFYIGASGATCRACGKTSYMLSVLSNEPRQIHVGVAALIFRDGKILLGQRLGSHGKGTWAPPGGHVEYGEEPEDTVQREVEEETGMVVERLTPYKIPYAHTHFPEDGRQALTLFYAVWCEGDPEVREPTKCAEWKWFDLDNLPSPLFRSFEGIL